MKNVVSLIGLALLAGGCGWLHPAYALIAVGLVLLIDRYTFEAFSTRGRR